MIDARFGSGLGICKGNRTDANRAVVEGKERGGGEGGRGGMLKMSESTKQNEP